MKQFNYKGNWYTIGDTIIMGGYFSSQWFGEKWQIKGIYADCSALLEREGKTKVIIGSVRMAEPSYSDIKPDEFNRWMQYVYSLNR